MLIYLCMLIKKSYLKIHFFPCKENVKYIVVGGTFRILFKYLLDWKIHNGRIFFFYKIIFGEPLKRNMYLVSDLFMFEIRYSLKQKSKAYKYLL